MISSKYKTMVPRPTIGPKKVIYNITTHKAQKLHQYIYNPEL